MRSEAAYAELGKRFELLGELGRGAMGVVFRARERSTGRDVALKVVLQVDANRIERFRREGELTARLNHPGIVRVHSFGEAEGMPYLAYELVESARGLDEVLPHSERRRQVELLRDAAAALGHAHGLGVVHRDVKPENVLVDASGQVRVADFGIALAQDVERLTRTGAFMGTPSYLAPEQIAGERAAIGPPSDVWALGVILYEALTGQLPFEGDSIIQLAAAIGRADPRRIRELAPDVPRALEQVCLRALRRAPDQRYAHGGALAADLDRFLEGESVHATPPILQRAGSLARRTWWALPVASAAGLVAFAVSFSPTPTGSGPPERAGVNARPEGSPGGTTELKPRGLGPLPPAPQRGHPLVDSLVEKVEAGDAEAAAILARRYQRGGAGVLVHMAAAEAWYRRAVALGVTGSLVPLGDVLLARGRRREAVEWWERGARTPGSEIEGARRMVEVHLVHRKDLALAVRWVRRLFELSDQEVGARHARALVGTFGKEALETHAATVGDDMAGAKLASAVGLAYVVRYRWSRDRVEREAAQRWLGRGGRAGSASALVRLVKLTQKDRGPVFTTALGLIKDRAAQGQSNAMWALGKLNLDGEGVPQNEAQAAHLFGLAAQTDPRAAYQLGRLRREGRGGLEQDLAEAARLWRAASARGHTDAKLHLLGLLVSGRVAPVSAKEPQRLLVAAAAEGSSVAKLTLESPETKVHALAESIRLAAEGGDLEAMVNAGQMSRGGKGLQRNVLYAGSLFLRAARKGSLAAMWELARLLLEELRDTSGYMHWLRKAAAREWPGATRVWGLTLFHGDAYMGIRPDQARGLTWLRKAHDKGDLLATLALADALTDPRCRHQDPAAARRLYQHAAEHGRPRGWIGVGRLLLPGQPKKARVLFEQAWKEGLPSALRWLAELHLRGWGVPKSLTRAVALLEKAAAQDVEARWILGHMGHTGRLGKNRLAEGYRRIQSAAKAGSGAAMRYLQGLDRGE